MSDPQAAALKLLTQLGIGVIALMLLGGVLYYQRIDRQIELDRVETLRNSEMERYEQHAELLQSMIRGGLERQEARAKIFVSQQQEMVNQGGRITTAVERQGDILLALKEEDMRRAAKFEGALKEAKEELIEVLAIPPDDR